MSKIKCKHGHLRIPENLYTDGHCRLCRQKARSENLEKFKKRDHDNYYKDHEKTLKIKREHRLKHPEKYREAVKKYEKNNPEKRRVWAKGYHQRNRDKARVWRHNYKARKRGNGGTFTNQEWLSLKSLYGFKCLCCGTSEEILNSIGKFLVPDHVIPLSKGGRNDIKNIQPLCHGTGGCNNLKHVNTTDYR